MMFSVMDLVYSVVVFSVTLLAMAQGQNYLREKAIKKHFKANDLRYILVCINSEMKESWENKIDRNKYDKIEILTIDSRITAGKFIASKLFEITAMKVGAPCLLSLEDNECRPYGIGLVLDIRNLNPAQFHELFI